MTGCRRDPIVAKKDPTPPVDAATPPASARVSVHGRLVDASTGAVVHALRDKTPRDEASDERAAYVLDDDALRAWELATGKPLWEVRTTSRLFSEGPQRIVLGEGSDVVIVKKADGGVVRKTLAGAIEEVVALPTGVAVRIGDDVTTLDHLGAVRATHHAGTHIERVLDTRGAGLLPHAAGFCLTTFAPPDWDFRCFDGHGAETAHVLHSLSKPSDPPGTRMTLVTATHAHAILGTFSFGSSPGVRRAAVIRLSDGKEVVRVEDELVALVEDRGALQGTIAAMPEVRFYLPSGALRWSHRPKWPESYAKAIVHDDRVVIARHNIIATGVQVSAHSLIDGTLLWTGETKLPPIGHSKYFNRVTLESRGDAVILRGHEASVEHVHLYGASRGELRYHDP